MSGFFVVVVMSEAVGQQFRGREKRCHVNKGGWTVYFSSAIVLKRADVFKGEDHLRASVQIHLYKTVALFCFIFGVKQ